MGDKKTKYGLAIHGGAGMGNIAMPFNTRGMFRGFEKEGQSPYVAILADDSSL